MAIIASVPVKFEREVNGRSPFKAGMMVSVSLSLSQKKIARTWASKHGREFICVARFYDSRTRLSVEFLRRTCEHRWKKVHTWTWRLEAENSNNILDFTSTPEFIFLWGKKFPEGFHNVEQCNSSMRYLCQLEFTRETLYCLKFGTCLLQHHQFHYPSR